MARRCRHGSTKPMESNWECANASGCSGSWSSVSASLVRSWPEQIRCGRRSIKKTPKTDGGRYGGPVGSGRSPLSAARIQGNIDGGDDEIEAASDLLQL